MSQNKLIVGLGNPDRKYENTRHNFGYLVVQELAVRYKISFHRNSSLQSFLAEGNIEENEACLLLPMTYMNNSGVAVKQAVLKKEIDLKNILVVCDDLNLPFGVLRLRPLGSTGGHNGLHSIAVHLGSERFARLRLGINHPGNKNQVTDYVLSDFSKTEKAELKEHIATASDCCIAWLTKPMDQVMSDYNKKEKKEEK